MLTRVGVEELFKPVGHLIIQLVVSNIEVGYICRSKWFRLVGRETGRKGGGGECKCLDMQNTDHYYIELSIKCC